MGTPLKALRVTPFSSQTFGIITLMPAIKHLEKLRSDAYFKDDALPRIVREMREAPSNAFVAMHDHEFSELVIVASGKISHIHADKTDPQPISPAPSAAPSQNNTRRIRRALYLLWLKCGRGGNAAGVGWVFWHLMQSTGRAAWTATRTWATESEAVSPERSESAKRMP